MPCFRKSLPLAAAMLAGCGYVGDPLPPALHIPNRVTDLRVIQRAGKILIDFTIPELTTEGLPLKLGKVDLRAGPYEQGPFEAETWAARAKVLDTAALKPGQVRVELPAGEWVGREVFFRVRIFSERRRDSGWSDLARLNVIPPLPIPSGLQAEAVAQGVRLSWAAPRAQAGLSCRIRRRVDKEASASEVASASGNEWVDTDTVYLATYEYSVQALVKTGQSQAESEISDPVTIVPVDRFPPAAPKGLTAVAGPSSIELAWERNTESDLRGYYLYRSTAGGPLERTGGLLDAPSYGDRDVKPGTRYRYAVSSVDQLGNESGRSTTVEAMVF